MARHETVIHGVLHYLDDYGHSVAYTAEELTLAISGALGERVIRGVLHYCNRLGVWIPYTDRELTNKLLALTRLKIEIEDERKD